MHRHHPEKHRTHRIGWLRASVLGANDGLVSVSSLVVGVASGGAPFKTILMTGVAGLVAGALSMAAGEYISVQSQSDTEKADLTRERQELADQPSQELAELAGIYQKRGLEPNLALKVAEQLTAHDALAAHARDELGITDELMARPIQAALSSAAAFAVGAGIPIAAALLSPVELVTATITATTIVCLIILGGLAALAGGASVVIGAIRVTFWGIAAMIITSLVGRVMGVAVSP